MRGKRKRIPVISLLALLLMMACVEAYYPPPSKGPVNYLVVDGFLNGTSGSASVTLTRAVPLSISIPNPAEIGATVSVEGDQGGTFSLSEVKEGIYQANSLTFDPASNYRLRILTSGGDSYTSDYIAMKKAPILDSISRRAETIGSQKGLRLYVSGHDPSNNTRYYRYLFTDTWEYRVTYVSDWKIEGGTPMFRNPITEQVYTCWKSGISTQILTASTHNLSQDVVSMYPINFIKVGARELSRMYSINVQQRAISQEEYEYWDLVRKTTENLGGLFDPIPSQVIGNVRNDNNATEEVLGYFSGGYVTEKRIFIAANDLPSGLQHVDKWDFECATYFVPINHPEQVGSGVFIATVGVPPTGWTASTPNCADCTSLGGKNVKPAYWPN